MNKTDIFESLASLSIEQLNKLHLKIEQKVAEKKARAQQLSSVPPRNQSDLEQLASHQGLDLSGLMREISKR
ncbi:hypothetical protein [Aliamphritea hakodatensis]|uniref:hypothetical protein n=1 Tax=Aliamphritea hakodatensis TaxID=2895352 RepID=UPI0022FD7E53|nr:hypothetical protein [Aliamphritea hakodatensis]